MKLTGWKFLLLRVEKLASSFFPSLFIPILRLSFFFYISSFNPFCYTPPLGSLLLSSLIRVRLRLFTAHILSLLTPFFEFVILSLSLSFCRRYFTFLWLYITCCNLSRHPFILLLIHAHQQLFPTPSNALNSLSVLVVISSHFIPHFPPFPSSFRPSLTLLFAPASLHPLRRDKDRNRLEF